jgi:hypothetical protein
MVSTTDSKTACKICSSDAHEYGQAKILNQYQVTYFKCDNCGFVFTEEPYWLEEAYQESINRTDTGLVKRNVLFTRLTRLIITAYFDTSSRFIDYGGGYGLFVRLMRDAGYDFFWHDRYSDNLLAKGFEAERTSDPYEMATAFEVFEHLVDPMEDIDRILKYSNNILFSTILIPENRPKPNDWWYYGLEHGQHIALYSLETLKIIAQKKNLKLVSNNRNIHLLYSREKIGKLLFNLLSKNYFYFIAGMIFHKKSLILADHKKLMNRI